MARRHGSKFEAEDRKLDEVVLSLRSLPNSSDRTPIWGVVSALATSAGLKGEHRRMALRLVATSLVKSRAFLDVATALLIELMQERTDADTLELCADLAESLGDYDRAIALRLLKTEAPGAPELAQVLEKEFSKVAGPWFRQRGATMSPMERFEEEIGMSRRLAERLAELKVSSKRGKQAQRPSARRP